MLTFREFFCRSLLIIFLIGLFFFVVPHAEAAILRLSPATGSFILGSTFDVSIILNTQSMPVNTIAVELRFPPDKLQIANPSLGRSIIQIWANPPVFSNEEGRIYLVGAVPSPGINISEGVVQSLTFRVVAPGEAKISFGDQSQVLANDGQGTEVLKQTSPAVFRLILPPAQGPKVFSPTHPEEGKWYKDPNPTLIWDKTPGSQGFSHAIDHDPNGVPDTVIKTTESRASFKNLESGTWYFHVREEAGNTWGGVSHYFLNIDTLPPATFGVKVSPGERTASKSPILRFFTTDSLSGQDHFEIKSVALNSSSQDTGFFFEASSPYQFNNVKPGRYEIVVRAIDKAGNSRDESVTLHILSSIFQFVSADGVDFVLFTVSWSTLLPILLILVLLILGILIYISWRHRHHLTQIVSHDFQRVADTINRKPYVRK